MQELSEGERVLQGSCDVPLSKQIPARAGRPLGLCFLHLIFARGTRRASEQAAPVLQGQGWEGEGSGVTVLLLSSSFPPSAHFSPLPRDTLSLSLPLFSSPSIPLSPSAPPAACQLPASR